MLSHKPFFSNYHLCLLVWVGVLLPRLQKKNFKIARISVSGFFCDIFVASRSGIPTHTPSGSIFRFGEAEMLVWVNSYLQIARISVLESFGFFSWLAGLELPHAGNISSRNATVSITTG